MKTPIHIDYGDLGGTYRAVCDACGWMGRSWGPHARAAAEGKAHECAPGDIEAYRRRVAAWQSGRVGPRKGTGMADSKAGTMEFSGQLAKVELRAPKLKQPSGYSSGTERLEGGSLVITIEVPRPKTPSKPTVDYRLRRFKGFGGSQEPPADPGDEPGEFEAPAKKPNESDEAYAARVEKAEAAHERAFDKWDRAHDEWVTFDDARTEYEHALAEWEHANATQAQRFASWMQLAGVGAVLQGLPVTMSLSPDAEAVERFLPGFSPALALAAPAEASAETEAAG